MDTKNMWRHLMKMQLSFSSRSDLMLVLRARTGTLRTAKFPSKVISWMFAMDWIKYAHWLAAHVFDMKTILT